ncbi:hypothetical protein AB0J28_09490 [Streptosporangium canum]|uniref:hypothetical protein n=1 Tax=Streptosporangium canum TaxID=324952 RepID=UPI003434BC90
MSAETLTPHSACAEVARLVAEQIAEIEQAFARRFTTILLGMRPTVHDNETWVATATFEASARVALALAGLPADAAGQSRTAPERSGTEAGQ